MVRGLEEKQGGKLRHCGLSCFNGNPVELTTGSCQKLRVWPSVMFRCYVDPKGGPWGGQGWVEGWRGAFLVVPHPYPSGFATLLPRAEFHTHVTLVNASLCQAVTDLKVWW